MLVTLFITGLCKQLPEQGEELSELKQRSLVQTTVDLAKASLLDNEEEQRL
jgi:hypothetical protein